ncbi:hypothetical protein GCM10010191_27090 [Actinomadura vinacea]|uniref:Uncharacterized protein n=1 Tax=Actinomadura vinacea TaxID=115336 RepID=A0ABP5VYY2_9ACTN
MRIPDEDTLNLPDGLFGNAHPRRGGASPHEITLAPDAVGTLQEGIDGEREYIASILDHAESDAG